MEYLMTRPLWFFVACCDGARLYGPSDEGTMDTFFTIRNDRSDQIGKDI